MKARQFKKLRRKAKYYDVEVSSGLFGEFTDGFNVTVLARNVFEACRRAQKRGYGRDQDCDYKTKEMWAGFKVKLHNKPNHFRHITYIK